MEQIQHLCKAIEEMMGHRMQSPKDFEQLRDSIYSRLHVLISVSTLKRVWGYLEYKSEPRQTTLDALAYFLGYADYTAFCQSLTADGGQASRPVVSRHINVRDELREGDKLTLSWQPGRICHVRYLGNLQFQVVSSEKTRLKAGDYFQCSLIMEGEPLYLSNLLQQGAHGYELRLRKARRHPLRQITPTLTWLYTCRPAQPRLTVRQRDGVSSPTI